MEQSRRSIGKLSKYGTPQKWEVRVNPVVHIVNVFKDDKGRKHTQFIVGEMNTCGDVDGKANADLIVGLYNGG